MSDFICVKITVIKYHILYCIQTLMRHKSYFFLNIGVFLCLNNIYFICIYCMDGLFVFVIVFKNSFYFLPS